jgi:threonine synthase
MWRALETIYDLDAIRETLTKGALDKRQPSVWKYIELLPLDNPARAVTLGEGGTRLLHARRLGEELGLTRQYLKDETKSPTGSFKDRKSAVAISKAAEFGFTTATSATAGTAGNAGASIAAYVARAALRAVILAFRVITKPKLAKLVCYGADVLIVDGTSWEVFQLTSAASEKYGWYKMVAASRYNPYVKDRAKTECIEICEQLRWNAPDWLMVPVGGGCGLASCWKAVRELRRIGLTDKLPRMVRVQGDNCAPLVKAFYENLPQTGLSVFLTPTPSPTA